MSGLDSNVVSTADILLQAKEIQSKIAEKIKANVKENRYLEKLLQSLFQIGIGESQVAPVKNVLDSIVKPELNLKMQLAQLAREHGVVSVSKLPVLFSAKNWHNGGSPESLKSQAGAIVRANPSVFERQGRGYFRLTSDKGNANRGLNKKPLVEFCYDALASMPKREGKLSQIAAYALAHGYRSQAKSSPLSTLVCQVVREDNRFIRVMPGLYRLRANS